MQEKKIKKASSEMAACNIKGLEIASWHYLLHLTIFNKRFF